MSARLLEFPPRRFFAIRVLQGAGEWLVLAGPHGWLHGDERSAIAEAKWLAANFGLPIRRAA